MSDVIGPGDVTGLTADLLSRVTKPEVMAAYHQATAAIPAGMEPLDLVAMLVSIAGSVLGRMPEDQASIAAAALMVLGSDLGDFARDARLV